MNIIHSEQLDENRRQTDIKVQTICKTHPQGEKASMLTTISKIWRKIINILEEYSAYRDDFIQILERFQEMWNSHYGQMNTATH